VFSKSKTVEMLRLKALRAKGVLPLHLTVGCCVKALIYVVGVALLRRFEMAVISCAGANGFCKMTLLGTPLQVQSEAAAPLM
jgi:hypothetical protein